MDGCIYGSDVHDAYTAFGGALEFATPVFMKEAGVPSSANDTLVQSNTHWGIHVAPHAF